MSKKLIALVLTVLMLCVCFVGCGTEQDEDTEVVRQGLLNIYENESFLSNEAYFEALADVYQCSVYESINDAVLAISGGNADYMDLPAMTANYVVSHNDGLECSTIDGTQSHFFMGVLEENMELGMQLSDGINALKASGELEALTDQWISNFTDESVQTAAELPYVEGRDTLIIAVTGDNPPLDYVSADGTPAGFNIALLTALSEQMGVNFELVPVSASARITALTTGKADALFWFVGHAASSSITDTGLFLTDEYYACDDARLCRAGDTQRVEKLIEARDAISIE